MWAIVIQRNPLQKIFNEVFFIVYINNQIFFFNRKNTLGILILFVLTGLDLSVYILIIINILVLYSFVLVAFFIFFLENLAVTSLFRC